MMRRWKILILALTLISAIAGHPTFASANQSSCDKYLPRLQGNWYDSNGNVYLQIVGKTLNGCPIVDIVNAAGGGGNVGLAIRISESSGYRDIYLSCINLTDNPNEYHQYIHYGSTARNANIALRRTTKPYFYESVGGIGLGMFPNEVHALYGEPNQVIDRKWLYTDIGLGIVFDRGIVGAIIIYQDGDRHFDRTGLNCHDMLSNYEDVYHLNNIRPKSYGFYSIGHNEYLNFEGWNNCVELSYFSN